MTDAAGMASELRLAVHRLGRRMRQQRPADGLSLTQLSTLFTICRNGPLGPGDIAALEGVKPPSTTRVLAALEERGLISRTADPTDGRQILVTLTDAGQRTIDDDLRTRDAWLAQQLGALDEADKDLLRRAAALLKELAER